MKIQARWRVHAAVLFSFLTFTGIVAWSQLGGATSTATATNPDVVQYTQQTGSNGTYILYVPGDGSKTTKQGITSGGGCATPTPVGTPILGLSANYYPNGYSNPSTAAVAGAYKSRTGVCAIPQAWSIEVNEGLIFSVGSNSVVGPSYAHSFSSSETTRRRRRRSPVGWSNTWGLPRSERPRSRSPVRTARRLPPTPGR